MVGYTMATIAGDEITEAVFRLLGHSVTRFTGEGSYSHEVKEVLYTVCGKYEEKHLTDAIMEIDPKAFVNIMDTHRVVGNFKQKPY